MKLHRAITLAVMLVFCLLAIAYAVALGVETFDRRSLIALAVVVVGAAAAGLAFSWRRYFPGRR